MPVSTCSLQPVGPANQYTAREANKVYKPGLSKKDQKNALGPYLTEMTGNDLLCHFQRHILPKLFTSLRDCN